MLCPHCGFSCGRKGENMTMATFKAALKLAEEMGSYTVSLGGGEPTIHPLFWEMLGLAVVAQFDSVPWLATNGKKTEIALRLANLAKNGKISCALSLDDYHDPISPEVVKAFTRPKDAEYKGANDFREIRTVKHIINAGRAIKTGVATEDKGCICDDLFVTPDGNLHPCGCAAGLKMNFGTVKKPNLHKYYITGNCAQNKEKWEEENG